MIIRQNYHSAFGRYLEQVSMAVAGGQDLALALAINSYYFNHWIISLIRLAEYSGSLPQTCQQLAHTIETQIRHQRIERSVRFLLVLSLWSLLILIAAIYNPRSTGLIKPEFWLRSLVIALLLWGISFFLSHYSSKMLRQVAMKLPIIGSLIQAKSLLNLAQLRLPLSCGVPILTALELLQEHTIEPVMRANLRRAVRKVRIGQPLSHSLEGQLPPLAIEMICRGEETGNLDAALTNLAEHYEGELERGLHLLQTSLQPLSLIAIASLVVVIGVRGFMMLLEVLPE